MSGHQDAGWLAARRELLAAEKAHLAASDHLAEARRALPEVEVTKDYRFEGPGGPETLADLFGPHDQLAVYHFMYAPDWDEGCKSCSFWADSLNGIAPHLAARGVALVLVATAPWPVLDAYGRRLGWSHRWSSAGGSDFGLDFSTRFTAAQIEGDEIFYNFRKASFPTSEAPGFSAFRREGGRVFHTYSTYARGIEPLNATYQLLDMMPKGRDESDLPTPMAWLRRNDSY